MKQQKPTKQTRSKITIDQIVVPIVAFVTYGEKRNNLNCMKKFTS